MANGDRPAPAANPGNPGNAFAAPGVPRPGFACVMSFCHCAGSAIAFHAFSHCSNKFCTAAGSIGGMPKGKLGGVWAEEDAPEESDDDEVGLEAVIPAFDLSVPKD
jgi:hypothetical protein